MAFVSLTWREWCKISIKDWTFGANEIFWWGEWMPHRLSYEWFHRIIYYIAKNTTICCKFGIEENCNGCIVKFFLVHNFDLRRLYTKTTLCCKKTYLTLCICYSIKYSKKQISFLHEFTNFKTVMHKVNVEKYYGMGNCDFLNVPWKYISEH